MSSGTFAMVVTYERDITKEQEKTAQEGIDKAFDTLIARSGATDSHRGGVRVLVDRIVSQVQTDLRTGEGIALGVSFIVLIIVFGGFLAAGMPVLGAIASIAGALASLLGFSHLIDLDASSVNVVTVLGLGLCIDYGLLIVSRYREELRTALQGRRSRDLTPQEKVRALGATLDRAGRTVIFSALIVAISLAGLAVFEIEFIRAVSAAAVSVVVVALGVALSLIPAMCHLLARFLVGRRTDVSGDVGVFSGWPNGSIGLRGSSSAHSPHCSSSSPCPRCPWSPRPPAPSCFARACRSGSSSRTCARTSRAWVAPRSLSSRRHRSPRWRPGPLPPRVARGSPPSGRSSPATPAW
jgi:RND superfamily putative drug exporter